MTEKTQQYYGLSKEDLLQLKEGEVVRYDKGYLLVKEVDTTREFVTGILVGEIYGVNALPMEQLERTGINIAKWVAI